MTHGREAAEAALVKAIKFQAGKLDLGGCALDDADLTDLLDRIARELPALRVLSLRGTRIGEFPDSIGQLTNLTQLDLTRTQLQSLPDSIGQLTNLTQLSLSFTQLQSLPDSIGQLTNLTWLFLIGTQLQGLPDTIGQLTNLTQLFLIGTQLQGLPDSIGQLTNLTQLDLTGAQLSELPERISELTRLETIHLRNNALRALPRCLGGLLRLKNIDVFGNPLPPELIAAEAEGMDELLGMLRAIHVDGERICEAKMVLVGEGGVGKTCLLAAMRGEPFVERRDTTYGIEIKPVVVTHEGTEIQLNGWDFGGQKIYRPTHQLFFTAPAVYLVIWKPREGPELGQVEYWISLIKRRAGEGARVHVVATHGGPGQRSAQLDRSKLQSEFGTMIAGFHHVDSETGYGIPELVREIATTAHEIPHVSRWYPGSWLKVRRALAALPDAYVRYSTFEAIAAEHGVSPTGARSLARNAHALGQLIHYWDDPSLAELVVLKADWLSVAIGFVLDDQATIDAHGLLPHRRLPQIWDSALHGEHRYSHQLQQMLLRLMERFDLSYRAPELPGHEPVSLIPQLLPGEPPAALTAQWDEYLPGTTPLTQVCQIVDRGSNRPSTAEGLMARLIVLFHRHSLGRRDIKDAVHWQNGVVLQERYGARALLTNNPDGLVVQVKGVNPQAFLNLLMYEIRDYVEGFWEGLKTKVLVPCPQPCDVQGALRGRFDLDQIYARLRKGKDTAECRSDCAQDVPISQLLECLGDGGPTLADQQAAIIGEVVSGALSERIEPLLRRQDQLALIGQRLIMARIGELGYELREQFSSVEQRLDVIMRTLDDEAADGPRLFTLEPVDRALWRPGVTKRTMRLTLWCEHSKVPVRLLDPGKPDAGVYHVDIPHDWWVKAAPLIKTTSTLLKALLPVSLPAIQADVDDNQWKAISEQLKLGKESLSAAAELGKGIEDPDDPGLSRATDRPWPRAAYYVCCTRCCATRT